MGGGHGKRVNNDGMPGTTSGVCLQSEFGSRRATNPWRAIPTIGTSRNRSLAIGTYSPVSDWGRCAAEAAHMSGIWQTFLTGWDRCPNSYIWIRLVYIQDCGNHVKFCTCIIVTNHGNTNPYIVVHYKVSPTQTECY